MGAMTGLGRQFNVVTSATTAAVRVSLKDCASVAIVAIGATSGNVTVNEANAATGGTSQALPTAAMVTEYFTQTAGVWTRVTQAAATTFPLTAAGISVVHILGVNLDANYQWVSASHATGSFVIIQYDLEVMRRPALLRAATL